jgi:hypothetical protein
MSYHGLLVTVALASWAAANTLASLVVCVWWRWASGRVGGMVPAPRSRTLFAARIAPVVCATLMAGISAAAFHRFEPRGLNEAPGWLLSLAATTALVLVFAAAVGCVRVMLATRRLRQTCERTAISVEVEGSTIPALRVECDFPIVAVIGTVRPRLFIARQVLEACDRAEVASIIAHEASHHARFDNLRRLIIESCPDLLRFTKVGAELAAAWGSAIEEVADDEAVFAQRAPVDLASALVRVARLAANPPRVLPAIALFTGGNIERRVKRLIRDHGEPAVRGGSATPELIPFAGVGVVLSSDPALRAIYEVIELTVTRLP